MNDAFMQQSMLYQHLHDTRLSTSALSSHEPWLPKTINKQDSRPAVKVFCKI